MFVTFFHELKSAGVPVTLREYLTLLWDFYRARDSHLSRLMDGAALAA